MTDQTTLASTFEITEEINLLDGERIYVGSVVYAEGPKVSGYRAEVPGEELQTFTRLTDLISYLETELNYEPTSLATLSGRLLHRLRLDTPTQA